jgi:hypothetical protein
MTGPFVAHETLLFCKQCHNVHTSQVLRRLVARHCNVGWDVLVFVGQSLFQRHRTTDQVRSDLQVRNVNLSLSEIEYLGRKFITYLARAHQQATPRIEKAMQRSGGYILHLDATHEGDAPALMTGMDGLSRIVLANVKIPSEHADHIVPFLRQLQKDYGDPIACVHDMGTGICKSVARVFPDTRDFVCHFHFLRDTGKDLLDPAYGKLRKILREHAVTTKLNALVRDARKQISAQKIDTGKLASAIKSGQFLGDNGQMALVSTYLLALWCLQGKKSGNGFGFPFDRPLQEFACRLLALNDCLSALQLPENDRISKRLCCKLLRLIRDVVSNPAFTQAVEELQWRVPIFDDLREKMRIANPGSCDGLNDDGTYNAMKSIRKGVQQFRSSLEKDCNLKDDRLCRKVAKQIDKYSDKLFADPIKVNTPSGNVTVYPQRTNNMLEQFFRSLRRSHRRKTGDNCMCRVLHTMLANTPLVKNLENPEYMKILLNGKECLEQLFAELETTFCTDASKLNQNPDQILPGFSKLLRIEALPERVIQLAMNGRVSGKSN